jgi:tRNA (mo5U34)-methyltransferase
MPAPTSTDELRRRAAETRWYHSMDIGHGIRSVGVNEPEPLVPRLHLPDLHGKSVLDVGSWDGFFAFEAERRGAERVLATDSFSWSGEGWGTKAGFELARESLGSKVEDREIDVMDLSPEAVGTFDVVLCLGVLYHMRDPVGALEHVTSVCHDLLVLETEVGMLLHRRPAALYYPTVEMNDDPTNWWAPNPAAVMSILKGFGFRRTEVVFKRNLAERLGGWARDRAQGDKARTLHDAVWRHRFVFHAWR